MGSIRLETLSDYDKHGFDLNVKCRACGHEVVLTPSQFFARGIMGSILAIEKRLRCRRCQASAACISSTMFGPSGGARKGASWRERNGRPPAPD